MKPLIATFILVMFASCSGAGSGAPDADFSGSADTPFTITDNSELIGGPIAQGRVGDVLLKNDRIRVIIQKPRKNASVNSFGGNIIDADIVRADGRPGEDNFGSIFQLVNIEWTVNNQKLEAISDGGVSKVVRAHGTIDVYDYLDVDFIGDVAEVFTGQRIAFSNRFDDRRDPFAIYEDLKGLSPDVITDFILEPGKNYVRMETTFTNNGDKEVKFPVGQFINGSGQNSMLIPGVGFSPGLMAQLSANTPAVIYAAFDDVDVSYGYFFQSSQFMDAENGEAQKTTSVSYSGVTGLLLGEEFLKIAPPGGGTPEIHFSVPAHGTRTIKSFFVVGNGSAGSVLDAGLEAIGATARPLNGKVSLADGTPARGATVAVLSRGQTLITYRTDENGNFGGMLPTGGNEESKRFGNGKYTVIVDKEGYHQNGAVDSGVCDPKEIDLATKDAARVECVLGEAGTISIDGPVRDADTEKPMPVRLTIVGEDPSPNKVQDAGRFRSIDDFAQPFGIVGIKYITVKGTIDLTNEKKFNLEPGTYRLVVSHGPEYSTDERVVEVEAGGEIKFGGVVLTRVVPTKGFVSSDFHVHSIASPDSSLSQEMRALTAVAEGLDILQSSDHDYIADYAPIVAKLEGMGVISPNSIHTMSGGEITPNHYGHVHAYPLLADSEDPDGGAIDWSSSNREEISPAPDYVWTLDELTGKIRARSEDAVVQINHLMDIPTGLFTSTGLVTTPFYEESFGVLPFSSYADPVERRMPPATTREYPFPYGTSGLVTKNFDVVEISIGMDFHDNGKFFRSALPTWFNLLNLGVFATAVADSDSHLVVPVPIGLPRNYIVSSVDPRDKSGGFSEISDHDIAHRVKEHRVTVSGGPFVLMDAKSETGDVAEIGGTIKGRRIKFTVDVKAPSWAWFDTIDIYANTEPIPTDDKTDEPMQGTAADPASFYKPYHIPRYTYDAAMSFRVADGTLESFEEKDGVLTASVSFDMNVDKDTWVVAVAYGTRSTEGFRSLFPIVTNALVDEKERPDSFDPANLEALYADKLFGAQAWGFTNPIFIDISGDGFEAKYEME